MIYYKRILYAIEYLYQSMDKYKKYFEYNMNYFNIDTNN